MYNYMNTSILFVDSVSGDDRMYNGYSPLPDEKGKGPVKTLEQALKLTRDMRVSGIGYPVTIKLINDLYLERPVCINAVSENKKMNLETGLGSVTIESSGERKRIIGGRKIEGWYEDEFNGVKCLSAHIDGVEDGKWVFTDLYVNGAPALLTHYPDSGTLKAKAVDDSSYKESNEFFGHCKWVIVNKEDLEGLEGITDAIISYCHCWIDEHSPVESYDSETGKLTFKYRSRFRITTFYEPPYSLDMHYILENLPSQFKNPGEWYLEREKGELHYIPRNADETAENIEVFAPVTDKFFTIKGDETHTVSNIRLKNLEFICSRGDYASNYKTDEDIEWEIKSGIDSDNNPYSSDGQSVSAAYGAIVFEHATNCQIMGCSIKCTGVHALEIKEGCHGIRIENCDIENIGGGGIKILGGTANQDRRLNTYGNIIRNNRLHNLGLRYDAGCGILICHSYENEVSDNEISYLGYSGISVGWVWGYNESNTHNNIIRGNHIHHVGVGKLSDMGGIYTLGCQPGTVIEDNLIHDVTSAHYGGWGIYPDEGSSYITIENNTVFNAKCEPFHMHYGMYNSVRNNLFAFGGQGIVRISAHENHPSAVFNNNTFISNGTPIYSSGDERFTAIGLESSRNVISDISGREPVLYSDKGIRDYDLSAWQSGFAKDFDTVVADKDTVKKALERIEKK